MVNESHIPCKGVFGQLFGHKLSPRFDTKSKPNPNLAEVIKEITDCYSRTNSYFDLSDTLGMALGEMTGEVETTYVHDICPRCGTIIKR